MKRTYIIFAVIFSISLLAQVGAMQYLLQTHDTGLAGSINLAGQQRMLSQRIAFDLNHLLIENSATFSRIRKDLSTSLEQMEKDHVQLIRKLNQRGAEVRRIYLDKPFLLDAKVGEFIRAVRNILSKATSRHAIDPNSEQVEYINSLASGVLPEILNLAVFQYQKEAEMQAQKTGNIILALSGLILLTMLLGSLQFGLTMRQIQNTEKHLSVSRFVFDHSLDGIITADESGAITSANPAIRDLLVTETGAIIGHNLFSLMNEIEEFENSDDTRIIDTLKNKGIWRDEVLNRVNKQQPYLSVGIRAVYNSDGSIISFVALLTDISVQKAAEERFKTLSMHDALTGLPNRPALFEALEHEAHVARREQTSFAFMMLDLDGFKQINDRFGHQTGDEVLKKVASRLKHALRESDIVARLGGDEFAIVQRGIKSATDIEMLADKLIGEISRPIGLNGEMLQIGCSIGASIYPEHANDVSEIAHLADQAMYRIKQSGKNHYAIYWSGEEASDGVPVPDAAPDRTAATA